MATSTAMKLTLVALLCMVVALPIAQAITCGQVASNVAPCASYVTSGGAVPAACCNGVKTLNSMAKTTSDRQAACNCLKQVAGGIKGLNPNLASGLPGKCGVSVPWKISTSTNCASVK
ncbi:non-specific lipid-transfer protein 1-like [Argentina anserina]|uniref:non-specific lipid-transfer protein 1-like n=1 Tax=Argentina anserina TaxID=57926 RepID=UPI0021765237|nr:non-specific lipid-transfer protein 1-like [Potentilla anserina]